MTSRVAPGSLPSETACATSWKAGARSWAGADDKKLRSQHAPRRGKKAGEVRMGFRAGDQLRRRHRRIPYPELGEGASFRTWWRRSHRRDRRRTPRCRPPRPGARTAQARRMRRGAGKNRGNAGVKGCYGGDGRGSEESAAIHREEKMECGGRLGRIKSRRIGRGL